MGNVKGKEKFYLLKINNNNNNKRLSQNIIVLLKTKY